MRLEQLGAQAGGIDIEFKWVTHAHLLANRANDVTVGAGDITRTNEQDDARLPAGLGGLLNSASLSSGDHLASGAVEDDGRLATANVDDRDRIAGRQSCFAHPTTPT